MLAAALALGSAALYGAADFLGGLAARRTSTASVVLLSQGSGLVVLAGLLPLLPPAAPSGADLLWGAVAGLAVAFGIGLLYRALAIGRMAVVAPTTAVCAVVIPVLAATLLGERATGRTLAGIALAIVSIVLVGQQRPTLAERSRAGLGLALLAGVGIGLFFLFLARTTATAGLWPLLVARAVPVVAFGAAARARRQAVRMPARVATIVIAGGILDMLANTLYLIATRHGPLGVVATLSSLYPASTVLLALAVLGERLSARQAVGIACALIAVLLIVGR